jgi:peptide/nickel transport system substrate-binding protein
MKLRPAVTLTVAAAALLAAGCSSAPPSSSSGTSASGSGVDASIPLLRIGEPFAATNLDPSLYADQWWVDPLILETMLQLGPQGQLEPELATSVTNPNPVTYIYHLRRGVRFWDGAELTAADAVYSLNHDRGPGAQFSLGFGSVKNIQAAGRYTVVVTLKHPDATWKYTPSFSGTAIFEMKFAEAHKGSFGKPGVLVMASGPWKIDSLDPTKGAELSANPHWWGGKVPIQHISFTFYASETSEALAFRAGEIDWDPSISSPKPFAATSGTKLVSAPGDNTGVFSMNTQVAPWNDVHVRRAVAYALSRSDLIAADGGYATPLYSFIPADLLRTVASPSQVGSLLTSLPQYNYNLAKARQEMAASAYPHGFTATIISSSDATTLNLNQTAAAELQQLGIHLQIKSVTSSTWAATESGPAGKRMTGFWVTAGPSAPDASGMNWLLGSQNLQVSQFNTADYAPAAVDRLLAASIASSDPAQRFVAFSQILQSLATDVPYVPVFDAGANMALSPAFTDSAYSYWFNYSPYALAIKRAA